MAVLDEATRNANLDALKAAFASYATDPQTGEITRLDKETKFLRSVLQGRGAQDAAAQNLAAASKLVQSSLNDFLAR